MRGYFLVFMLINHMVFTGGLWLVEINHRNLAFVEDAERTETLVDGVKDPGFVGVMPKH